VLAKEPDSCRLTCNHQRCRCFTTGKKLHPQRPGNKGHLQEKRKTATSQGNITFQGPGTYIWGTPEGWSQTSLPSFSGPGMGMWSSIKKHLSAWLYFSIWSDQETAGQQPSIPGKVSTLEAAGCFLCFSKGALWAGYWVMAVSHVALEKAETFCSYFSIYGTMARNHLRLRRGGSRDRQFPIASKSP
jgi:hypothetical protein